MAGHNVHMDAVAGLNPAQTAENAGYSRECLLCPAFLCTRIGENRRGTRFCNEKKMHGHNASVHRINMFYDGVSAGGAFILKMMISMMAMPMMRSPALARPPRRGMVSPKNQKGASQPTSV